MFLEVESLRFGDLRQIRKIKRSEEISFKTRFLSCFHGGILAENCVFLEVEQFRWWFQEKLERFPSNCDFLTVFTAVY